MDGCLPCPNCHSNRLIPDVHMGKPTLICIHCIDCGYTGEKADSTRTAILEWNVICVAKRKVSIK